MTDDPEDFEVSLFLTETDTRHSLLYKHRKARDKTQTRLVSNSAKLTGASSEAPIDVDNGGSSGGQLVIDVGEAGDEGDEGDIATAVSAVTAGVLVQRIPLPKPRRLCSTKTAKRRLLQCYRPFPISMLGRG